MTSVATIDFDAVFADITARLEAEERRRRQPPLVRLFDGNWNLRGYCMQENSCSVILPDNETGTIALEMPADYYLSKWAVDVDARATTNIHVVVDKDGARVDGRLDELKLIKDEQGRRFVRLLFKTSYEELKHILAWANPWLPAEIAQGTWVLFGQARWCAKTTLLCNLIRLEASLWMLPDDPLDLGQWLNFDISTWSQIVAPDLTPDTSPPAIIHSRFKTMHEATRKIVDDAQLSWQPRRYLDGDDPPWPGAVLRNGCLVWDLADQSGWTTGTSFGGDLFGGLISELISFGADGVTEITQSLPDPAIPTQALTPGWRGSLPSIPAVIYRDGEHTGVQTSEFSWKPATDVQVVAGGHSMPGINEAFRAAISMVGDLTAMIPGVPPLGGVADALISPLLMDKFMAFGVHKMIDRAQRLGWSHYHERFAEGADKAYTLSWLLAMRTGKWVTRESTRCTLTVADGAPWRIGQHGHGHFWLGDRIGFTVQGMKPGKIFVERVSQLELAWDRDTAPTWIIQVGQREPQDPIVRAFEQMQDFFGILQDLGVT